MNSQLSVIDNVSTASSERSTQWNWYGWSDWLGMVASIGCAIHCAAMPFVIAYLPTLGLTFLADAAFHQWMAVGCFAVALTAFVPGLRRHGRLKPVLIGGVGLAMISVAAFGFDGDCCSACEQVSESAGKTSPIPSETETAVLPNAVDDCDEACCAHCAGEASAAVTTEASMSQTLESSAVQVPWFGAFIPWLTPMGGLTLVSAHLLNRRYGCLCGCCDTDSADTQD